ncbi:MAG: ankyrin repeat domain-containing protein [Acidobacteriia bacterium]|nr:ankyrin repeat domain-containing protein [Terriglobia bacterium]
MRSLIGLALLAQSAFAQAGPDARQAVMRALPLLERSASEFVAQRACISCHHNILPVLMLHLARRRGVAIDEAVLRAVEEKTFRPLRGAAALDEAVQAGTLNDPTPNDSFLLMAAHEGGVAADLTTGVYALRLVRWQREGHWVTSDFRPPHSSSTFTATASAVRAIRLYLPEEARAEGEASIRRAREWLVAAHPASTEDATFRLLGLVWAGAAAPEVESARKDLIAFAKPAGGWPELPGYAADAYSTGEALYALHESGAEASDRAWRRGLQFLLRTQAVDGSWRVRTRMVSPAQISPAYFSSGFPYAKDEYLSYAGSCWAVMALLSAMPEAGAPPSTPAPAAGEPWTRTALFGTARQLAAELDAGLDVNRKTRNGTTLLMMAAPDAAKVRLLVARGADVKARAASGCDALTIAAAYRGTADAVGALLDAGAAVQAGPGVHARNAPLLFAALTGDGDNVKLLLAHGADPSATPTPQANTPVAAAVTFGYADVVQTLIAAGASVTGTEGTGINLLHWAVIADRPTVIPILIAAGASLNARDENGYTPLMYAATIDFGDAEAVRALLQAGADRTIRNAEGRTALEQARHYEHRELAAALR